MIEDLAPGRAHPPLGEGAPEATDSAADHLDVLAAEDLIEAGSRRAFVDEDRTVQSPNVCL